MSSTDYSKLDNPVWFSIAETHHAFGIDHGNIKFYQPEYCPFGAFIKNENLTTSLESYSSLINHFFIVGEQPMLPALLAITDELKGFQMIIENKINVETKETIIALNDNHADELYELVNLVQPGYYRKKTMLLGDFFGIFKNEKLVAAAGQRMQMNHFTEISAIVTHPDHIKNGYAQQLTTKIVNDIFTENKIPFLHVLQTNAAAIALYEKLGFKIRREISFWQIDKQ